MSSTMIPPLGRGVLATGRRVGKAFHLHVLGSSIIRDQLHDGDVMVEARTAEKVTRMRTELYEPVPLTRPKLSPVELAVARAEQDTTEVIPVVFPRIASDETAKLILGIPFRRALPGAAR